MAVAVKNAVETRGRPFQKGNPGRPKGAKNKIPTRLLAEAAREFDSVWAVAKRRMRAHLRLHEKQPDLDCATCRHHITMIAEYRFGKPMQPISDWREEAQRIAREVAGIDDPEVAERLLRVVK